MSFQHDESVRVLAYLLWEKRGAPFNDHPESDWIKSEEILETVDPSPLDTASALSGREWLDLLVKRATPVILRNAATGRYVFVSSTERGGDNVVEAKGNMNDSRSAFILRPANRSGCYQLLNTAYGEYLFCSSDIEKGDNVAETHSPLEDRNAFDFQFTGNPADRTVRLFNPACGKYLFDSSDVERGDNIVELHRNPDDARNVFQILEKYPAIEWLDRFVRAGTVVTLRNAATGRYVFVSSTDRGGDNIVESKPAVTDIRTGFILKAAGTAGHYQLYNAACGTYVFCSGDIEKGDNVAEAHQNQEDRNSFELQVVGNPSGQLVRCYNPSYEKYLFDSSDMERGDNMVELHGNADDARNVFKIEERDQQHAWMQDNRKLLGSRTLRQICIPGSHDAGLSFFGTHTGLCAECNTVTQSIGVLGQLRLGARYFDVRPVISAGDFLTGHYQCVDQLANSWQGANGQSIDSIIDDVNTYTGQSRELVILWIDHLLNTDVGNFRYRSFNEGELGRLIAKLKDRLQNRFTLTGNSVEKPADLTNKKLDEFFRDERGAVVVIIDHSDFHAQIVDAGFFIPANMPVSGRYTGTNSVDSMASDQLAKMRTAKSTKGSPEYFLMSWTLTQSATQAATCALPFSKAIGNVPSIRDLAREANDLLMPRLLPECTDTVFPNIVLVDDITVPMDDVVMRINRLVKGAT